MDACRRISWDLLPSELLERILRQKKTFDAQELLRLQLVSRTWEAATRAFSGHLQVEFLPSKDKLAIICKKLPNISNLEIGIQQEDFDLSPVSCCSALTKLLLRRIVSSGMRSRPPALDLTILPSGLRSLKTHNWQFVLSSVRQFKSVDITKLDLSDMGNTPAEICQLLGHLPLKELSHEEYPVQNQRDKDLQPFFRFPQMTELRLEGGTLVSQLEESLQLPALHTLTLFFVEISQAWLDAIYASNVEDLSLGHCHRGGNEQEASTTSAGRLRQLQLYEVPFDLLPHEAPHLKTLTIYGDEVPEAGSLHIAQFTSLTTIDLSGLQSADLRPLQGLPLQSVSLSECKEAGLTLFAPGSVINPLTDLQRIHFAEKYSDLEACCDTLSKEKFEGQRLVQQLSETAGFIQSLSSLEEVTGVSKIFQGFKEGLNGWKRNHWVSGFPSYRAKMHVCLRPICLNAEQAWARQLL